MQSETNFPETANQLQWNIEQLEVLLAQAFGVWGRNGISFAVRSKALLQTITKISLMTAQGSKIALQQLHQFQELARMSALVTSSLHVNQVLEEVVDTIIKLTATERAYLMVRDQTDKSLIVQVARNWDRQTLPETLIQFSHSVVQIVLKTREPILTINAQSEQIFQGMRSVVDLDLRSILCIPLLLRGELIGVLYADSTNALSNLSAEALPLLTAFANQASISIANAQLYERVQTDLENSQREVRRHRLQEAALASNDVLPTIVETISQVLAFPYAAITLKEGDQFVTHATHGEPGAEVRHLPLIYQSQQVGELLLSPRELGVPFSKTDQYLIDELIKQAGVVVHTVRLAVDLQNSRERLVTAREEERLRLRRDLHDGLGPMLATLILKLDTTRNLLLKGDLVAADTIISELKNQVQTILRDVRLLIYALRPPALDELGLRHALREHLLQLNSLGSLQITCDLPVEIPPLAAAVEVAAYRIISEAVNNVVRHAHAFHCHVSLSLSDRLSIEVVDNGIGITAGQRPGIGILSMRERSEELGGNCIVQSRSAGGTQVLVWLPLAIQ